MVVWANVSVTVGRSGRPFRDRPWGGRPLWRFVRCAAPAPTPNCVRWHRGGRQHNAMMEEQPLAESHLYPTASCEVQPHGQAIVFQWLGRSSLVGVGRTNKSADLPT